MENLVSFPGLVQETLIPRPGPGYLVSFPGLVHETQPHSQAWSRKPSLIPIAGLFFRAGPRDPALFSGLVHQIYSCSQAHSTVYEVENYKPSPTHPDHGSSDDNIVIICYGNKALVLHNLSHNSAHHVVRHEHDQLPHKAQHSNLHALRNFLRCITVHNCQLTCVCMCVCVHVCEYVSVYVCVCVHVCVCNSSVHNPSLHISPH